MARIRTIKPEFFTSLTIAGLPIEARMTFIGLWTHVDDEGRCVDDARLVKAAVWPLDDRLSADVEADLRILSESSLILRYKVGARSFIAVRGWGEHQRINRPTRSKLPAPSEADEEAPADPPSPPPPAETLHLRDSSSQSHTQLTEDSRQERNREQGTGNREGNRDVPRKRGTRLPDDFAVTDEMKAWFSANCPGVNGQRETEKFRNYWQAAAGQKGVKLDWPATWRNWMLSAAERGSSPTSRTTGANRHTNERDDNPFRNAASAIHPSRTTGAA